MTNVTRRQFLQKSTMAAAGAAAAVTFPSVTGQAQSKFTINVGLIGCGGRGSGALSNVLEAGKVAGVTVRVVALADAFQDRLENARARYRKMGVDVPASRCFHGFDAYRKLVSIPEINYVMMATPPGFRPWHFEEAIRHGKNVFMEKPVGVDGPGIRRVFAAADEATRKGLSVVAGTQRRHQKGYIETIKRIQDGAIGEIKALRAYWNGGAIWHRGGDPNTIEGQLRNWYHYVWFCGDHIVEQHVHNLDVCNWIMGAHPIRAYGQGGRQALGPNVTGMKWDHFAVEYEYPNGVRMFSQCRQISRTDSRVSEAATGTKGESNPGGSIVTADGKRWRFRGRALNPYVQEHVDLINAIRSGKPVNEGRQVAESTLTAILGRESAYSGKIISWDQMLNSKRELMPKELNSDMAEELKWKITAPKPVVPIPGIYKFA
ncbi:MAG: Gfo/Idh/MocA family oxidoreductase [Verrucomicrobia bacterium]|nr:Gfo/Idh/MocA family oxidoreductase [Verrucomicrobiota bacterium]